MPGAVVIDLSADFRLKSAEIYKEFYAHDHPAPDLLKKSVYGLARNLSGRNQKIPAHRVAGLLSHQHFAADHSTAEGRPDQTTGIIADSMSGVSGAGRKAETDYLFVECNESVRPYGVPKHRHLSEIEEQLSLAAGEKVIIQFTPHLIPINRGILTTLYLKPAEKLTEEQIAAAYKNAYGNEPFVRLLEGKSLPDTKNVAGTNVIEIAWRLDPRTGRLDRDERRGQSHQGRQRPGRAKPEHPLWLAGNGGLDLMAPYARRGSYRPDLPHTTFANENDADLRQQVTMAEMECGRLRREFRPCNKAGRANSSPRLSVSRRRADSGCGLRRRQSDGRNRPGHSRAAL